MIQCAGADDLKGSKERFLKFTATHRNLNLIRDLQRTDAICLFQKGIQSYFQGVEDLLTGYEAWATVKLYYSTYYFLRCELAINGFSILRCPDICVFTSRVGEKPTLLAKKNRNNDHKSTIEIFSSKFSQSDVLLSQNIGSQTSYEWLSGMREWANYRSSNFPEVVDKGYFCSPSVFTIEEQITLFLNDDDYVYCFDQNFACLALPSKRAQLTAKNFRTADLSVSKRFKKFMEPRLKRSPLFHRLSSIDLMPE
jgi:hypothetical protein